MFTLWPNPWYWQLLLVYFKSLFQVDPNPWWFKYPRWLGLRLYSWCFWFDIISGSSTPTLTAVNIFSIIWGLFNWSLSRYIVQKLIRSHVKPNIFSFLRAKNRRDRYSATGLIHLLPSNEATNKILKAKPSGISYMKKTLTDITDLSTWDPSPRNIRTQALGSRNVRAPNLDVGTQAPAQGMLELPSHG